MNWIIFNLGGSINFIKKVEDAKPEGISAQSWPKL